VLSVPTECPRCKGKMELGFMLGRGHGALGEQQWLEGEPIPSFWSGLQTRGRERLRVTSYRCERCGYLESYANEHVDR
jgi:hypothetical protein